MAKKQIVWDNIPNWKEQLVSLYNDGVSINKLAMMFSTSSGSIRKKLVELGISIRGRKYSQYLELNKRLNKDI